MIIAFSGLPRVGKSLAVNYLTDTFSNTISYAFALPFKKALCEMFLWKMEDFEDDTKELVDPFWGISKRDMMEYIGTEIMRKDIRNKFPLFDQLIQDGIWVKRLELFMQQNPQKDILISDLRFLTEYKFLRNHRAILVEIERPYYKDLNEDKCYDIPKMKFDLLIKNNLEGDLDYFKQKVFELYNNLKNRRI